MFQTRAAGARELLPPKRPEWQKKSKHGTNGRWAVERSPPRRPSCPAGRRPPRPRRTPSPSDLGSEAEPPEESKAFRDWTEGGLRGRGHSSSASGVRSDWNPLSLLAPLFEVKVPVRAGPWSDLMAAVSEVPARAWHTVGTQPILSDGMYEPTARDILSWFIFPPTFGRVHTK